MKKFITKTLILAAAMACLAQVAKAQDVTVLHMKDGTTHRFANGIFNSTNISFWSYVPDSTVSSYTTRHNDGYTVDWNADAVWHVNGQYSIGVCWVDDYPTSYYYTCRHGLLFGSTPNLTADHCDSLKYYESDYDASMYTNGRNVDLEHVHYMIIGQDKLSTRFIENTAYGMVLYLRNVKDNRINAPLEIGKTYYYRTFIEPFVLKDGKRQSEFLYGPEKSIRIPRVMADFGYSANKEAATDEACAAFTAKHINDSLTVLTWDDLKPLWTEWRATDEGSKVDLTADTTTEQFEDGTGYRLNRLPDEFWAWLKRQEIVIDAFDDLKKVSTTINASGEIMSTVSTDRISNDDAAWGIPGGKYIRFTPLLTTVNHSAMYNSMRVVPGVHYRLQINFAPETQYDDEESMLPTRVRVEANGTTLLNNQDVSATSVTTLEVPDFCTTVMGLDLLIATRVTSSQVRNKLYNRILRIAEIRLTPLAD